MKLDEIYKKINELTDNENSPFFYYSSSIVKKQINLLTTSLPKDAELFYSLKANSNDQLLDYLVDKIHKFDVASMGELELLIRKNISPKNIHFTGPGKNQNELLRAIELNVGEIVVESIDELKFIEKNLKYSKSKVLLRIHFSNANNYFGIDENEIIKILEDQNLNKIVIGFHYHQKSQHESTESLIKYFMKCKEHFCLIQNSFPNNCKIINFGSGFPIQYYKNDKALNLELLHSELNKLTADLIKENIRVQFEAGRFLVAESGFYCCKILYIKNIQSKNIVVLDGGLYHFMAATGVGKILRKNFPIDVIHKTAPKSQNALYTIIGNTCSELDIFADDLILSELSVGDWIIIHNAGAYALQYSPLNFILHQHPKEIFLTDDN